MFLFTIIHIILDRIQHNNFYYKSILHQKHFVIILFFFLPMQFLGPAEKGMYAYGCLLCCSLAETFPVEIPQALESSAGPGEEHMVWWQHSHSFWDLEPTCNRATQQQQSFNYVIHVTCFNNWTGFSTLHHYIWLSTHQTIAVLETE